MLNDEAPIHALERRESGFLLCLLKRLETASLLLCCCFEVVAAPPHLFNHKLN